MGKLEKDFQKHFIHLLNMQFNNEPHEIIKMNPENKQGIPDLLFLCNDNWALFECKKDSNAVHQPNQDYYVDKFNGMSYASFVYPENVYTVLDEVKERFGK